MYREWGPAVPGGGRGGCLGGAVRGHGFSDPQGLRAGFSRGPPPPLPDGSGITSPPPPIRYPTRELGRWVLQSWWVAWGRWTPRGWGGVSPGREKKLHVKIASARKKIEWLQKVHRNAFLGDSFDK